MSTTTIGGIRIPSTLPEVHRKALAQAVDNIAAAKQAKAEKLATPKGALHEFSEWRSSVRSLLMELTNHPNGRKHYVALLDELTKAAGAKLDDYVMDDAVHGTCDYAEQLQWELRWNWLDRQRLFAAQHS